MGHPIFHPTLKRLRKKGNADAAKLAAGSTCNPADLPATREDPAPRSEVPA